MEKIYRMLSFDGNRHVAGYMENKVNECAAQGWSVVSVVTYTTNCGSVPVIMYTLEKLK